MAAAVGGLHDQDLATLTDPVLLADVAALAAAVQALSAELVRRVAELDARDATSTAAALPTAAWLRHRTRMSPRAAGSMLRTGHALRAMPVTAAALGAGQLHVEHVAGIAAADDALCRAGVSEAARADAEHALVHAAASCDPDALRRRTRQLQHALAPLSVVADEVALHDLRYLHLRPTLHGMLHLDGMLDPEAGATLQTALDALSAPDPVASSPDPGTGGGAGDAGRGAALAALPPRTPAQRRADALTDLARLVLDGKAVPTIHHQRPHATVTVDLGTLTAQADTPGQPPARLGWAGPISGEAARRLLCDARVTRLITDPPSMPLDIGRATRTVPPWLYTALSTRDRHCVFPGCHRPPEWCDAHHLTHWAHGGDTALTNLVLLCTRHHHAVHEGGWRITLTPHGTTDCIPPDRTAA